jgi:hypothetical protein
MMQPIPGELERARRLVFAADEAAAHDLLLSLMPRIEQEDRDDLALEAFAQLGEIYLARGSNDRVRESIRRIRDCVTIYSAVSAGTMPDAAAQVRMSDAEVTHMLCRYSRRAQFLQIGLAAALGDHEGAARELAPHATALLTHVRSDDPRILDLVRAGAAVADEVGVDDAGWSELHAALDDSSMMLTGKLAQPSGRRDDYALAAGADASPRGVAPIARTGSSRLPVGRWSPSCGRRSSGRTRPPASGCN